MEEIWKDVVGYEGIYQVSNKGNVLSLNYGPKGPNHFIDNSPRIMRQTISTCGYRQIMLYKDSNPKVKYVHRLVAEAFIQKEEGKQQVNHKDGNKLNNDADNLEWVSARRNTRHAIEMGLRPVNQTIGKYGSNNPLSRPVDQYDLNGNLVRRWDSCTDAAEYYSTSKNSIRRCINGHRKTHRGFIWKYSLTD